MLIIYVLGLLLVSTGGQYAKSGVKGGYGGRGFQDNTNENIAKFYANNTSHGFLSQNHTVNTMSDVGVCYIEVPTAQLVEDQRQIPKGNGSRPDLSVIRSCCNGYVRNIYNPNICEPHCSKGCVNALCTAPEICTCFPDHVKNAGGFCIATCPIGCQNGHCSGRECVCRDGFKLDYGRKYCVPACSNNCAGVGNCTSPNRCDCAPGYQATHDGSCSPQCRDCAPEACVAPNVCSGPTRIPLPGQNTQIPTSNYPGYHSSTFYNRPGIAQGPLPTQQPNYVVGPSYGTSQPVSDNQLNGPLHNTSLYPSYSLQQLNNSYPGQQPQYPLPNQPQYPWQQNPHSNQPNYTLLNSTLHPHWKNNYFDSNPSPYQPQYPGPLPSPGQQPIYPTQQFNQTQMPPHYPNQNVYPYPSPLQPWFPGQIPANGNHTQNGFLDLSNRTVPGQGGFPPHQGYYPYPLYQPSYPQPGYFQPNQSNSGYYGQQPTPSTDSLHAGYYTNYDGSNPQAPVCSQPCLNGVCVEGNRCSCNTGYVTDSMDPSGFRCIPHCAGGCPNGVCSAPNLCICNMGYKKDTSVKGRSVCVKKIR
ncbi:nimrod B precursor [Bombyx mori]|uniref:Fibrillin-like protein n=1 Tax=Bombyx mori TaxID=7091 RepID=Q8WPH3_BOMMO|nr:nimrod B precursor [Bombyx mori]BAB78525.1 fibrillin-like protein [Bombyx mori]